MNCPFSIAAIGLVGVLVGALIGHWLTLARDRAIRRRTFSGFLLKWRLEISSFQKDHHLGSSTLFHVFKSKVPDFIIQVELVRDVFRDRQGFELLTKRLAELKDGDCGDKQPREIILFAIDELVKFVT